MTRFLTFLMIVAAGVAMADDATDALPAKYRRVVDRFPFGEPPPGFDPMATMTNERGGAAAAAAAEPEIPLTEQQEALQKTVVATAIVFDRLSGKPWLGFTDTSNPKAPKPHYVQMGAVEDGWRVVDVDMAKKTAKLAKGEVEIEVEVGAQPAKQQADTRRGGLGGRRPAGAAPAARSPLLVGGAQQGKGGTSMASLRRQRQEREAAQRRQFEEERKARLAADEEAQRRREEDEKRRAQERAEREAERQAEREEYNQRVKNLAAALEEQMAANSRKKDEDDEEDDDD